MESMHFVSRFNEVWDCNWVHPQTLHHLTPTSLCKKVTGSSAFTAYTANYAASAPARVNHHPSLSSEEVRQSQLFCIFPGLIASVSADTLVYLALHPLATGKVAVKWGLSTYEATLTESEKQARIEKWQQINAEDHQILSRLHCGLSSSKSVTGP